MKTRSFILENPSIIFYRFMWTRRITAVDQNVCLHCTHAASLSCKRTGHACPSMQESLSLSAISCVLPEEIQKARCTQKKHVIWVKADERKIKADKTLFPKGYHQEDSRRHPMPLKSTQFPVIFVAFDWRNFLNLMANEYQPTVTGSDVSVLQVFVVL